MDGLTPRQEKFCIEYASCSNAYESYMKAGYKVKNRESADASASQLLRNPKIQARLHEIYEKAANDKIADVQEMQERLTSIIRMKLKEEQIVVEGCGDGVTEAIIKEKLPSCDTVIRAINTLGKMQGAFTEKVEQTVDMDLNINIDYGE